ncbi:hypothetical protein JIG36_47510 [Actinoplanes sp. LDG1-06]|uniref:Uncharacterized protein n=1 Tax=Paractinoplanes ovalisporus TaxID=2810368 RepID=A0ABS2ATM8_9ACTN|nr:hypothetical protein [Actinoplanes ovalisporus]MBM2623171.1 hypothetical protein [Actinoplanes ovalisporus]
MFSLAATIYFGIQAHEDSKTAQSTPTVRPVTEQPDRVPTAQPATPAVQETTQSVAGQIKRQGGPVFGDYVEGDLDSDLPDWRVSEKVDGKDFEFTPATC